jgi:uncharacterized tellurite resistance protein B-like protein
MFERIFQMFAGGTGTPPEGIPEPSAEDLRMAAAVLLLELAWADDEFSAKEQHHLESALVRHFGLTPAESRTLMEQAEAARSGAVDLWRFTRVIRDNYSLGQKMVLAEAMWGLVYADGVLSEHEDYLIRRVSNLLGIQLGYLSQARQNWRVNGADAGAGDPPA